MTLLCPCDDVLRETLRAHDQKTQSTELLTHLSSCLFCQDRIIQWGQQSEYGSLMQRAGSSEIEYQPSEPANKQAKPAPQVRHGKPDSVTTGYEEPAIRRINNYDLIALIGTGGSANVYRGRHFHLHRPVAVKLLLEQYSHSEMARTRFFREMKSIGQLDHPYIVHAYDAGEWEGDLYLVMELVMGENVDSFSRRIGPMPIPDSCEIIRQAALGLQHIHENNLVHRDLKPSNLLISRHGIKIADLGLALVLDADPDHRLTGHQTVLGTADYMSPEQAEGSHEVDIRSDLYSLGCTLFRLLVAQVPYGGPKYDTPIKKMVAHASQPFPDLREFRSDIPAKLITILQKLMAKDRAQRYATPLELAEALEPFCGDIDLAKLGITAHVQPARYWRSGTHVVPTHTIDSNVESKDPSSTKQRVTWGRGLVSAAVLIVALISFFLLRRPFTDDYVVVVPKPPPGVTPAPASDPPDPPPSVPKPPDEPVLLRHRTKLEHQWNKLFGLFPEDLPFPGRLDLGADHHFSDALGSLNVQSTGAVRMIQLGVLKAGDDSTISITAQQLPKDGIFGIFAGLDMQNSNGRDPSRFHEFLIQLPIRETGQNLVQWGYCTAHPTQVGWFSESQSSIHQFLEQPQESITLEVRLKPNELSSISINRKECVWHKLPTLRYSYLGSYGIIVRNGNFSFVTPEYTRNRK